MDSDNAVHIVFNAFDPFGVDRSNIFYVKSDDGANSFTSPVRLNDDRTNTSQSNPSIAVTEEGTLGVKWWDRRNDPRHDGLTDVYMTISADGGRTWRPNFRISDHNWVFGPIERGLAPGYHGDYDAMAGGSNRFLPSWSDERNNDPDVFFSAQQAQRNHDLPDFNLSADKLFDGVIAGHSVEFPLSTQSFHGFSGTLKLSAAPAINGITYNFSSVLVKPGDPASLSIQTDASVEPGTYLISASAADNRSTRSTSFRLSVYPPTRTASVPVNATDTAGFTTTVAGLKVDPDGVAHLVYDDDSQVGVQVLYKQSRDGGATFSPPVRLSTNSAYGFLPSLALDSGGNVYVVWAGLNASFTERRIFLSKSTDHGASFSAPAAVTPPTPGATLPTLAVDSRGNIMVVYLAGQRVFAARSTDGGTSFSVLGAISGLDSVLRNVPYVAYDSTGAAYAVYTTLRTPRVRLAIASDGVIFAPPKTISSPSIIAFGPHLAVDASDTVHVTFVNIFFVTGRGRNDEVMLITSTNHGLSFGPQLNVSNNFGLSRFPVVIAEGFGQVTIAWQDTTENDQLDVFVAHSADSGASFGAPFNVSGNSGLSSLPFGAADARGKVFLGWTDDSPSNPDIFVSVIPF